MLFRVCLILAILAGASVVVLSQFKVRPHMEGIIQERETEKKNKETQTARAKKAEKSLGETQGKLQDTAKKLEETESHLSTEKTRANTQEERATGLQKNLDKVKEDLTSAQRDLAAWKALGIPVEVVQTVIAAEKKLRLDLEALGEEKGIITKNLERVTRELDRYRGGDKDVEPILPGGLKGKVLVVDPKWDFVVLNIGQKHGVIENGVMMVSRNGRLVAKVRIVNVQQDRSIANVMPGWKLREVMEGDQVLY